MLLSVAVGGNHRETIDPPRCCKRSHPQILSCCCNCRLLGWKKLAFGNLKFHMRTHWTAIVGKLRLGAYNFPTVCSRSWSMNFRNLAAGLQRNGSMLQLVGKWQLVVDNCRQVSVRCSCRMLQSLSRNLMEEIAGMKPRSWMIQLNKKQLEQEEEAGNCWKALRRKLLELVKSLILKMIALQIHSWMILVQQVPDKQQPQALRRKLQMLEKIRILMKKIVVSQEFRN